MSQENLEIARRAYAMFAAGDLAGVGALFAADAEIAFAGGLVGAPDVRRGPEGFIRAIEETQAAFEDYRVEPEAFIDAGDAVLVPVRIVARGQSSGVALEARLVHVWMVADGKVVRGGMYESEDEAREAMGLSKKATSQDNVGLIRTVCAPWQRGDFGSAEWADPQIEFGFADGPTPGTWTGIQAMGDAWREALRAFDRLEMDVEGYIPIDGERVLVLTTNTGRGKTSGFDLGELRTRGANVFHIRDGKVTKLVAYWDRDRALEALGLSE